jgi:hypothetical protein
MGASTGWKTMDRSNHYENAFAAFLRQRQYGYIAVNESRRSLVDGDLVKSLDFIVYGSAGVGLLVDVKGRKFPGVTSGRPRHVWECWVAADDIDGLRRWEARFGTGYRGVLVFVYRLAPAVSVDCPPDEIWEHRGWRYRLRAVPIDEYERFMRTRSPSWRTVDLPARVFQTVARPFRDLIDAATVPETAFLKHPMSPPAAE